MALPLKMTISGCSVDPVNGTYGRPAMLHNGFPVYKHTSEVYYIFHDGVKRWMVNDQLGTSAFMFGEVAAAAEAPTQVVKWVVYSTESADWEPENEIKVVCTRNRKLAKPPAPRRGTRNLQLLRSLGGSLRYLMRFGNSGAVPEGWTPASDVQLKYWEKDPNELVYCPKIKKGCCWHGPRKRLQMHEKICGDILRVHSLVNKAGGKNGTMAFALSWSNDLEKTDLDMSVTLPCGYTIDYDNKQSPMCSGALDVDDRGKDEDESVENVSWTEDPPYGQYTVQVTHFEGPSTEFILVVKAGHELRLFNGYIEEEEQDKTICSVEWGLQGVTFSNVDLGTTFERGLKTTQRARSFRQDWDCTTDEQGWCTVPDKSVAVRVDVPLGDEFSDYAPTDVYCKDVPLEVAAPKFRR